MQSFRFALTGAFDILCTLRAACCTLFCNSAAELKIQESPLRTVDISKEPVELYKILKFEGLVTTGGEAKLVIGDGQVTVNGEIETRKRKKIVGGDTIVFGSETLLIRLV